MSPEPDGEWVAAAGAAAALRERDEAVALLRRVRDVNDAVNDDIRAFLARVDEDRP